MAAHAKQLYRQSGPVLIRATTDPGGLALPENFDLHGDAVAARAWLTCVWDRESVREAVQIASPDPVVRGNADWVIDSLAELPVLLLDR